MQEAYPVCPVTAHAMTRSPAGTNASRPRSCGLGAGPTYTMPMPKSSPLPSLAEAMASQADAAADLLKTLGNPQRLRILCLLVEGEHSVGEINAHVPLSQSALSQHLAVLREQGLVETRREAQTIFYALSEGPARALLGTLHDLYCPTPEAAAPATRKAPKTSARIAGTTSTARRKAS